MTGPRKTYLALAALVVLALGLRVAAALVVHHFCERRGERFLFPDSEGYSILAEKLAAGEPYAYGLGNARRVMRTPGYPLFLAALNKLFGESLLAARLAGGVLGAVACLLVYLPGRRLVGHTAAVAAVGLAAVDPYFVLFSVLLLSETLFAAAVLVNVWAMLRMMEDAEPAGGMQAETHWAGVGRVAGVESAGRVAGVESAKPRNRGIEDSAPATRPSSPERWGQPAGGEGLAAGLAWAAVVGLSAGVATLVRPSWLPFCPLVVVGWVVVRRRRWVVVRSLFVLAVLVLSLVPWAWRNWRVTGHFVPLTLWVGASLYDGLHRGATGASDMRFLEQPPWKTMDEFSQDRELRRRAWEFVRDNPADALRLAGVKFLRFWSPWPNAPPLRTTAIRVASLLWAAAVMATLLAGIAVCRRQPLALVLLVGPVLYLCAIHLAFVGSIRYRIPGMYPLMSLAGLGLVTLWQRTRTGGVRSRGRLTRRPLDP